MPIEISRLLGSSFNSTLNDSAWRAGVTLWLKSWYQVPAGSLPDDDQELTKLAELGRDIKGWRKLKSDALRGWFKADDGLLYHKVVAEKALEAWIEKLNQRLSSGAGNAKQYGHEFDRAPVDAQIAHATALLMALNGNSKTLQKMKRRKSRSSPTGTPDGTVAGIANSTPEDIQTGSQETGTGTEKGIGESISNETLSPARARSSGEFTFADFEAKYPRPDGLAAAVHDWNAALTCGASSGQIMAGLDLWLQRWRGDGTLIRDNGRWLPTAETWLTEQRWLDPVGKQPGNAQIVAKWPGPEAIREAVVIEAGDGFATSYLDTAQWLAPQTIIARGQTAADKLRTVTRLKSYTITTKAAEAA